jgi:GTPase SAR1 family protein
MFSITPNPLSSDIAPLDKQVIRTDEPLPLSYINYIVIGKKGSGKSTLILNLLKKKSSPYYKKFDNIYLISPTAGRDTKFEKLVDELKQEDKYYDELNDENISEIINRLQEFNDEFIEEQEENKTKEKPNNLLILDDCLANLPSSNAHSLINKIFTNARHYKLSIWCLVQKYNKLNPLIRTNSDLITIFSPSRYFNLNSKPHKASDNVISHSYSKSLPFLL